MNKKAVAGSLLLYLGLAVTMIILVAIFVGQQQKKTEETVFKKLWSKFFPSKMETVIISGTTVGAACKKIVLSETDQADGTSTLAQAVVDCYKDGQYIHKNTIKCCYTIDASKIKYSIDEAAFRNALDTKGQVGKTVKYSDWYCGQNYEWKVGKPITSTAGEFTLCYDYQGWTKTGSCDDVFLTTTPDSSCD